jgi:hypothetical protein
MPDIKFIKTERKCGFNETIRQKGETLGIIYDYAIMIDGVKRGEFRRNVHSNGYELFDTGYKAIKNPDSTVGRAIRANSKSCFLQTVEHHIGIIPTDEQIKERQAAETKAADKRDAAAAEERRIRTIKEAGVELLTALETAKWMLVRDYIDPQKLEVIEKCEAAIKKAKGE